MATGDERELPVPVDPSEATSDGRTTRRDFTRAAIVVAGSAAFAPVLSACGSSGGSAKPAAATAAGPAKRGGRFRVAMTGNGTAETHTPGLANSLIDNAHVIQVYDTLTVRNDQFKVVNSLAEEMTPNASADEWTIRLPQGVEFHNGKTLTADDLIYTIKWTLDKKNASFGAVQFGDVVGYKKLDERTVRIKLRRPNSFFDYYVEPYSVSIIPDGTKKFDKPIGTGPFKLVSFAPGKQAVYERFENYRYSGKPYLDRLEIISIDDPLARVNALIGGQVDAAGDLPPVQVKAVDGKNGLKVNNTPSAQWTAMAMHTASGPFKDPRVRQAMRLLIDREQIKQNVFLGYAEAVSDVYGRFEPWYPEVPLRPYDPEKAKSLLKAAGQENLATQLQTGPLGAGHPDMDTLFAEQARKGGTRVQATVHPVEEYWAKFYEQRPFFATYWSGNGYVLDANRTYRPGSAWNEGQWDDPQWASLYNQALAETDRAKATELLRESQMVAYDHGPYIIPVSQNYLDGYNASKFAGVRANPEYPFGMFHFDGVHVV
jgi:peptide/nickel transport system substrate-binding protein